MALPASRLMAAWFQAALCLAVDAAAVVRQVVQSLVAVLQSILAATTET